MGSGGRGGVTSGSSLGDYDSSFLFDYLNVRLVFGGGNDARECTKLSSGNVVLSFPRVVFLLCTC